MISIKNRTLKVLSFVLLTLLTLTFQPNLQAGYSPPRAPEPPEQNPHPPVTDLEKKAVLLSETFIKTILTQPLGQKLGPTDKPVQYQNKNLQCLSNQKCWKQDVDFLYNLSSVLENFGQVVEWRHAHVIPWSIAKDTPKSPANTLRAAAPKIMPSEPMGPALAEGEYMVHTYVRYKKMPDWFHLDLILVNDENNQPALRYLYTVEMPSPDNSLPPGVVCQNVVHDIVMIML